MNRTKVLTVLLVLILSLVWTVKNGFGETPNNGKAKNQEASSDFTVPTFEEKKKLLVLAYRMTLMGFLASIYGEKRCAKKILEKEPTFDFLFAKKLCHAVGWLYKRFDVVFVPDLTDEKVNSLLELTHYKDIVRKYKGMKGIRKSCSRFGVSTEKKKLACFTAYFGLFKTIYRQMKGECNPLKTFVETKKMLEINKCENIKLTPEDVKLVCEAVRLGQIDVMNPLKNGISQYFIRKIYESCQD